MPGDSVHVPESANFSETLPAPGGSSALLAALTANKTAITTEPGVTPTASQFGKYQVIGELGEGGMGRVYKAVDTELGRFVAVKVLRSTDPFECSRFRGEAEMIASLDHPNIVKVYDVATPPGGRPYIVLEHCDGGSLDKELGGKPIEPRKAAEMLEVLARAVQYAHDKGVIHRDLKPANVLRGKDRQLKLTDFGLAKNVGSSSGLTVTGAVMGTPSYMAPEQASGQAKELGPAADVYGLGVMLYEMLTGRPPFQGVQLQDVLDQVRWAEPASPSLLVPRLPRNLSTICLKCLHKTPSRRYATAGELADDLRAWMDGRTILARPAPRWERLWRQVRRRPWEAATVVASVLLVVLLAAGWMYHLRHTGAVALQQERQESEQRLIREREEARAKEEAAERANKERIQQRAQESLAALGEIRDMVLDGELSRQPDLKPLYVKLGAFYQDRMRRPDAGFSPVQLAEGLVKVGDLFRRTGQDDEARKAYQGAIEHCRALPAADARARDLLADALLRAGQMAFEQGADDADREGVEACGEVERLLGPFKADGEAAGRLAEAHHLRGQFLQRDGDFARAEAAYRAAVDIRRPRADKLRPDLSAADRPRAAKAAAALLDLGRGYAALGEAQLGAGRVADAEASFWASNELRGETAEALKGRDWPEARDAMYQFARSWNDLAGLHARSGLLGTARRYAEKSLEEHTRLLGLDKVTVEYKLSAYSRHVQVAELEILAGVASGAPAKARVAAHLDEANKGLTGFQGQQRRRAECALAVAALLEAVLDADANPGHARARADRSAEMFAALCKGRRDEQIEPAVLYYRAAVLALQAELAVLADRTELRAAAVASLRTAVDRGYAARHPDSVAQFRAFRALAADDGFKEAVAALHARPRRAGDPVKTPAPSP